MNNHTYIQDLTNAELLEHIRDFADKPRHLQQQFDYDLHMAELQRRSNYTKMLTRADILRALNDADLSQDGELSKVISENYYIISGEQFVKLLGFEV
jgi:sulfite reductase alpha subunit-like flavoprotein